MAVGIFLLVVQDEIAELRRFVDAAAPRPSVLPLSASLHDTS